VDATRIKKSSPRPVTEKGDEYGWGGSKVFIYVLLGWIPLSHEPTVVAKVIQASYG